MFDKVMEQYRKDVKEHEQMIRSDPYYAHSCGGGTVPVPCCKYCQEYDGDRCHVEWNNNDPCYYEHDRDDKEPDNLCELYSWSGEWEDD